MARRYGTREPAASGWEHLERVIRRGTDTSLVRRFVTDVEERSSGEASTPTPPVDSPAAPTVEPQEEPSPQGEVPAAPVVPEPPARGVAALKWGSTPVAGAVAACAVLTVGLIAAGLPWGLAGFGVAALIAGWGSTTRRKAMRMMRTQTGTAPIMTGVAGAVVAALGLLWSPQSPAMAAAAYGVRAASIVTAVTGATLVIGSAWNADGKVWRRWQKAYTPPKKSTEPAATETPEQAPPPARPVSPVASPAAQTVKIFHRRETQQQATTVEDELKRAQQAASRGAKPFKNAFPHLPEDVAFHAIGAAAEKNVGEALERALPDDFEVAHDIRVMKHAAATHVSANIDHLVSGPTGMVMVDTKHWSGTLVGRGKTFDMLIGKTAKGRASMRKTRRKTPPTLRYEAGALTIPPLCIIVAVTGGEVEGGLVELDGHPPIVAVPANKVADYIKNLPTINNPPTLARVDKASPRACF